MNDLWASSMHKSNVAREPTPNRILHALAQVATFKSKKKGSREPTRTLFVKRKDSYFLQIG